MVLSWLGAGDNKPANVADLIARKKYDKAIEALRAQFATGARDSRVRMQMADVLVLAGRGREAVPILEGLADELAADGFAAKAIALFKKIEKIDPGRKEIDRKLASLIQQERPRTAGFGSGVFTPPPPPQQPQSREPDFGMEEIGDGDMGTDTTSEPAPAGSAAPQGETASSPEPERPLESPTPAAGGPAGPDDVEFTPPAVPDASADPLAGVTPPTPDEILEPEVQPVEAGDAEAEPEINVEVDADEEQLHDQLLEVIQEVLAQNPPVPRAAVADSSRSPLFSDFTEDELLAVMAGLKLLTFAAGDIIITEGEPGSSLFVLTTGVVKAFVRDPAGRHVQVRQMDEGAFFGEISILTGRPRTATITAATACELLELDRATMDQIALEKPGVWKVLQEFHKQRANNAEEARIRSSQTTS